MENNTEVKKEVEITKSEEDDLKENNNNEKQNSYSNLANLSHDSNEHMDIDIENDIFNEDNDNEDDKDNELTDYQLEHLNKIREQAQRRMEKYSDLSTNSNLIIKTPNNINTTSNIDNNDNNNGINIGNNISNNEANDSLSHNFLNNDYEENQTNEINPNLERVFNRIHPYLFINNEPLLLINSNILYYIIIFSASSFFSIIFYSLKNESYFIMKFLFLMGYLFYGITYTLLMILNPGIPTNKNNTDLNELKMNYNQCNICNCIFYKNNDYITFHCKECNICVEKYERHFPFASKCIGKNNRMIYKLWLISIPSYIIIIFLYIII